jgi:hypothetical protein
MHRDLEETRDKFFLNLNLLLPQFPLKSGTVLEVLTRYPRYRPIYLFFSLILITLLLSLLLSKEVRVLSNKYIIISIINNKYIIINIL